MSERRIGDTAPPAAIRSQCSTVEKRQARTHWRHTQWLHACWPVLLLAAATILLGACSGDPGTGPARVIWDRDVCARCNMVLSDRAHAAQVRYPPAEGKRSQVEKFDDLGCAVLWLDQQPWRADSGVEIWVSDYRDGSWIDARQAHYVSGRVTPMQYGLGATTEASPGAMDFAAARQHIYRIEQRFNIHGGNLEHREPATLPPIE